MWEDMVIQMALFIIKSVIKNPAKAAGLQAHLIELRNDINALYPGQ